MTHTIKERSALVRAAEHSHNQKQRPVDSSEIVMAERNKRAERTETYGIAIIAVVILVAYIAAAMFGGVQ